MYSLIVACYRKRMYLKIHVQTVTACLQKCRTVLMYQPHTVHYQFFDGEVKLLCFQLRCLSGNDNKKVLKEPNTYH